MGILIEAQVEGLSTRKDKTIKITIGTQELDSSKAAELIGLNNALAFVYISAQRIEKDMMDMIDDTKVDMLETIKSPAKRLKAVFYLLFHKDHEGYTDFEMYYAAKMEKVIGHYKTKIDE